MKQKIILKQDSLRNNKTQNSTKFLISTQPSNFDFSNTKKWNSSFLFVKLKNKIRGYV